MRICISGTQCIGKSTLIQDFLKEWPMYKKADMSYRDKIKNNPKIKLNKEGNEEGQRLILDILIEQAKSYTEKDNIIFDRGILDNLIYTMWLNHEDKTNVTDLFVEQTIQKVKNNLKYYDILFFIPLSKLNNIPIVEAEGRNVDPQFREEIDHLFKAVVATYYDQRNGFFPAVDCPAVIDHIVGSRSDRINQMKYYINPRGHAYTDADSLLVK